jgi:hypothetical protein
MTVVVVKPSGNAGTKKPILDGKMSECQRLKNDVVLHKNSISYVSCEGAAGSISLFVCRAKHFFIKLRW